MLTCVRFNLILLKFDIVKLLLCNTNTTSNANEIKALTRVESENNSKCAANRQHSFYWLKILICMRDFK